MIFSRYLALVFLICASAAAYGEPKTTINFGARVDCMHDFNQTKGGSQDCVNVSGLQLSLLQEVNEKVQGRLRLDPFGSPSQSLAHFPRTDNSPNLRATKLGIVDDYGLTWNARPNLQVSIENFGGAALLPDYTGLSSGGLLQDAGWNQTALTLGYTIPVMEGLRIKFAVGNGEGEIGENLDAQQYAGFQVQASVAVGMHFILGLSSDGNNIGSDAYDWQYGSAYATAASKPTIGFSTQRMALAVALDGKVPAARGLKTMLGWQRVKHADIDKDSPSVPDVSLLSKDGPLDPGTVLVEDPSGDSANSVQHDLYFVSFNYRLLDNYFIALEFGARTTTTGVVDIFQPCSPEADGTCVNKDVAGNKLVETSITAGGGLTLAENLILSADYNRHTYDQVYQSFYFLDADRKPSDKRETFMARISYNWL